MDGRKIIHVRFFEPYRGETDYYFGSLAAIYDVLPAEAVGMRLNYLRCCFAKRGYRIETPECIIRAGYIHRKPRAEK